MTATYLLAIVEVSKEDRVLCRAEGCGHSVFKRIHVVQDGNNGITVLGSECFKRLYGHVDDKPRYGDSEGRKLTNAERQMLEENTLRFIEQLEAERLAQYQRELEQRALQQLEAAQSEAHLRERIAALKSGFRRRLPFHQWLQELTPEQHKAFEIVRQETREAMRVEFDVDPDLPGFVGSINVEARARFEANARAARPEVAAPPVDAEIDEFPQETGWPENAQTRLFD